MARYHVSEDGNPRVCTAQSPESCTARGVDGNAAPHGDFADPQEARRFAEEVLEKSIGGDGLSSASRDNRTLEEKADDLRESVKDFRNPATSPAEIEEIRKFWAANGVSNQFMASAEAHRLSKEAAGRVADRSAFSTDMTDSSEYRVQGGRLKAQFEGEDYDLGELREVSREEINSWSQETFQEDANFQDGEVFPVYSEDGDEAGAYARFGDRYYRASTAEASDSAGIPDREATPGVPRLLDTPAAIAVDNVPEMEGWRKVRDLEVEYEGPHLVGPQGEIIAADSLGDWSVRDSEGTELGTFENLADAFEELDLQDDREPEESYMQQYIGALGPDAHGR